MANQLKQDDGRPFSADESGGCSHPADKLAEHFVATRDELELLALHWIQVAADMFAFRSVYDEWCEPTIQQHLIALDRVDEIAVVIGNEATARICAEANTKQSDVQVRRADYLARAEKRLRGGHLTFRRACNAGE
jgi:hypothetical protein